MNTYSLKKDTYISSIYSCHNHGPDFGSIKSFSNSRNIDTYGIIRNLEKIDNQINLLSCENDTVRKLFSDHGLNDEKVSWRKYIPSLFLFRFFRVLDLYFQENPPFIENCISTACEEYNFLRQKNDMDDDWNICFSTHPWDILTMSMRGVASCMSWSAPNSTTLLGSIIDPNCGIIYLTDNSYGSLNIDGANLVHKDKSSKVNGGKDNTNMLYRSVVRLIKLDNGDKALFLEAIYTSTKNDRSIMKKDLVLSAFVSFLKTRTKLKIYTKYPTGATIPSSPEVQTVINTNFLSYRDSGIKYS